MTWSTNLPRSRCYAAPRFGAGATPVTTQTGTLRRVSRYQMYVVNERWTRITLGCGDKYRLQCLRENPGVEALEQHVGEPVQVEFCGKHVVGYTVAGRSYRHGQRVGAGGR